MKIKQYANRLYKIIIESCKPMCLMSKTEDSSWLWHKRLGHVNFQAMSLMSRSEMVCGVPRFTQPKDVYSGCLMAKHTRKPFLSQTNFNAKKVLELVHGDLCGPISPETPCGNKYFFLLVDDYSRFMWVFMLKNKGEALEVFKKFKAQVEGRIEEKLKVFRTDRGGEFRSKEFTLDCEVNGIARHYTASYSPQ